MKYLFLISILFIGCSSNPAMPGNAIEQPVVQLEAVKMTSNVEASQPQAKCKSVNGLPDPICSPGVARTQDVNIICHQPAGPFRPTMYQELAFKKQIMAMYGIANYQWHKWILDHVIAIQDGGDGFDLKNMFLQPKTGKWNSRKKDLAENLIHRRICSGQITPAAGQQQLATNWQLIK